MFENLAFALLLVLALSVQSGDATASPAPVPPTRPCHIDSGSFKATFDSPDGKLRLCSLSNGKGMEWINKEADPGSLWALSFVSPEGKTVEVLSSSVSLTESHVKDTAVEFEWDAPVEKKIARITMKVRADKGDPISHWSLKALLPDGWKVTKAVYPIIPNITVANGMKMAAPAGWGIEYQVQSDTAYHAIYPSCSCSMQFIALYAGGNGLYIGTHDPQANHKEIDAKSKGEHTFAYQCVNWPGIPEKAEKEYEVPFEAAIGVFDGDYYAAAQIYREFSLTAPWGKAGPVSKRPIPKWLTENDLWLMPGHDPLENVDDCARMMEYFKVPAALHWYEWHQIPFDTLYPDYFPAKTGFKDGVKALQSLGYHVMPYINGRLCDPNSIEWQHEGAAKWALQGEDGKFYTEIYGSKVPLNPMCPYTDYWHKKIAGIAGKLVNECGVDGVYIDQIAAAYACKCFNPNHGHPVGGGHFWVDGYRKLLDEARKQVPKDHILTTEENTECWIDQFDALLLVNTPTCQHPAIPLFPAVYSGRAITFGSFYIQPEDIHQSLPFRLKIARQMLWGAQLGWVNIPYLLPSEVFQETAYLRSLARTRRFGHDYLTFGRFLGMVDVRGENPHLKGEGIGSFGGTYPIDVPSVMASKWIAEDGSQAIVMVNMSDLPHEVEIPISLTDKAKKSLKRYDSEGLTTLPVITDTGLKLQSKERSATIVTFQP